MRITFKIEKVHVYTILSRINVLMPLKQTREFLQFSFKRTRRLSSTAITNTFLNDLWSHTRPAMLFMAKSPKGVINWSKAPEYHTESQRWSHALA